VCCDVYFGSLHSLADLQILSGQVPQSLQAEEEPPQGRMDKGAPQGRRQGAGHRSQLRVREAPQRAHQIQPRNLAEGSGQMKILQLHRIHPEVQIMKYFSAKLKIYFSPKMTG